MIVLLVLLVAFFKRGNFSQWDTNGSGKEFFLYYLLLGIQSYVCLVCWRWDRGRWIPLSLTLRKLWLEEQRFLELNPHLFFCWLHWASFDTNQFVADVSAADEEEYCGEQTSFSLENQTVLRTGCPKVFICISLP